MTRTDNQMMIKIRKSLARLTDMIERQPIIFMETGGRHWLNGAAREFISGKVAKDDFIAWLRIGAAHLQNFSYGDIDISLMRLPEGTMAFLSHEHTKKIIGSECPLTRKETDVLRYLARGYSNRKIAENMNISPGTVNSHLDNIYQKLDCSSRSVACLLALKYGLLLPSRKTPRAGKT